MVVCLRHCVANMVTRAVMLISYNNLFVDIGMGFFQPCGQCRSQVVTNGLKVAFFGVGPVTLGGNFFVVVGKRSSSRLSRNSAGKRVLSRRLIKMTVHAEVGLAHL